MNFSVVLPFRDTPRERKFAEQTIPALAALKPSEIIIGADAPANPKFEEFVRGLCGAVPCVMVWTKRDPGWGFHLAHVTWGMYAACQYNTILTTCVDVEVWPAALAGSKMTKDHGIVACAIKSMTDTLSGKIRWMNMWWAKRHNSHIPTGIYWMDRSWLSTISENGLKHIKNGIDTRIREYIVDGGGDAYTIPGITGQELDIGNSDYPWRQFGLGIWIYANHKTLSLDRRWRGRIARRLPILYVVKVCLAHAWPWVMRGYMFAKRNTDHIAVSKAHGKTYDQYCYLGTEHIRNIRDWEKHGRLGTGYD